MTDPARSQTAGPLRPADGLCLLGEYRGSGFAEPRFLVRRGDGQVMAEFRGHSRTVSQRDRAGSGSSA